MTKVIRGKENATPNAEFKIRPVCATGWKSPGGRYERAVQYFRYNELVKYTNILKYSAASRSPRIMPGAPAASFQYAYRV